MFTLFASVAAALSAIGIYAMSSRDASNQNAIDRDFQREMLQRQQDYEDSVRHEQQEYNTPVNQAARFRQAGFNPALMAGSLSSQVGQFQNIASAPNTNRGSLPDTSSLQNAVYGATNQLTRLDELDIQQQNTNIARDKQRGDQAINYLDALTRMREVARKEDFDRNQVRAIDSNIAYQSDLINIEQKRLDIERAAQKSQEALNNQNIELLKSQAHLNDEQANYLVQSLKKLPAEIAELYSRANNNNAQAAFARSGIVLNHANAGVAREMVAKTREEAELLVKKNICQTIQNGTFSYEFKKAAYEWEKSGYKREYFDSNPLLKHLFQSFVPGVLEPFEGVLSVPYVVRP